MFVAWFVASSSFRCRFPLWCSIRNLRVLIWLELGFDWTLLNTLIRFWWFWLNLYEFVSVWVRFSLMLAFLIEFDSVLRDCVDTWLNLWWIVTSLVWIVMILVNLMLILENWGWITVECSWWTSTCSSIFWVFDLFWWRERNVKVFVVTWQKMSGDPWLWLMTGFYRWHVWTWTSKIMTCGTGLATNFGPFCN